jgi:hypothetical protein
MAYTTSNQSITPHARPVIEALNRFAARPDVLAVLRRAQADAMKELQRDPNLAASFISLDLASPGFTAPDGIGSVRVVVTRDADGDAVERHANSIQYLFALDGPVETHVMTENGWRVDRYGLGDAAVLEDRWHVVPLGLWHKTVAPGASNWGIVAFHSAREVIDEYQ